MKAADMHTTELHVGTLVRAADNAAMLACCACSTTPHSGPTQGIVVDTTSDHAAITWIDYRGPQHRAYLIDPALLVPALPEAPAAPHSIPSIQIAEHRYCADYTRIRSTGLRFITLADANNALRAIADAYAPLAPSLSLDPGPRFAGNLLVVLRWSMHTTVYRLETVTPSNLYERIHAHPVRF